MKIHSRECNTCINPSNHIRLDVVLLYPLCHISGVFAPYHTCKGIIYQMEIYYYLTLYLRIIGNILHKKKGDLSSSVSQSKSKAKFPNPVPTYLNNVSDFIHNLSIMINIVNIVHPNSIQKNVSYLGTSIS